MVHGAQDGPLIVVAAALIRDDRVLVQERPAGKALAGLWEFPGGKVEAGETCEAALVRELSEELGIALGSEALAPHSFVTGTAGDRPLLLLLYVATEWAGEAHALEASALCWANYADLCALPMPPADVPLVAALRPLLA
ncbi:8-oxo-dGTP diphosphatase [Sphingomonas gellani]|uniref:8-oxo-dGTP diphosphatase n=1 Tax=Sphingomonas gellani TaxID=1166340 RepID=A0A1H7ZJP8_9SPHN|nr:(deoxy)nucleoside triphosphate pyrophosphohydrolase [Sphingomonas gellani]SEM58802.1 8-oxo-dGTP diphosphatase [Sphingomonas gellani]